MYFSNTCLLLVFLKLAYRISFEIYNFFLKLAYRICFEMYEIYFFKTCLSNMLSQGRAHPSERPCSRRDKARPHYLQNRTWKWTWRKNLVRVLFFAFFQDQQLCLTKRQFSFWCWKWGGPFKTKTIFYFWLVNISQ